MNSNRDIHKSDDGRYINDGINAKRKDHSPFVLIHNSRQTVADNSTEHLKQQVVSINSTNRPNYVTIAGTSNRIDSSKLSNVGRTIVDVNTTRDLASKLSKSEIKRQNQGRLINKDIEIYKRLTHERISKLNENVDRSYSTEVSKILNRQNVTGDLQTSTLIQGLGKPSTSNQASTLLMQQLALKYMSPQQQPLQQ